ncbi:hypothetical protein LSH36_1164g00040 [Paralvinella palmiformis]|uniref:Uncharacterized protein n=1 Tax=Paralvinella palmiformis TaxID=53620 RepID=A0AAD9MR55_9ANNE|nr:hypothetical protein LSH36_1164g00040 [Paralvinella palmiformis]
MTILPSGIPLNVSRINLSNDDLETCCTFPDFTSLMDLNLNENKLVQFPNLTKVARTLTMLHIANNRIRSVPEEYAILPSLLELDLTCNELQQFPNLTGMRSLGTLMLQKNNISWIPGEFLKSADLAYICAPRQ